MTAAQAKSADEVFFEIGDGPGQQQAAPRALDMQVLDQLAVHHHQALAPFPRLL